MIRITRQNTFHKIEMLCLLLPRVGGGTRPNLIVSNISLHATVVTMGGPSANLAIHMTVGENKN